MSRMDHSIILAGRQPNFVNAFAQGQAARAASDQMESQNALRNLYQTQGADILAGDPTAMNALARHNPEMALSIQGQHQAQAQRSQKMKHDRQAMELRIRNQLAQMDEAAAQKELAR